MKQLLYSLCCLFLLCCSYPSPDYTDWDMTPEACDPLRFLSSHHYTTNDNFQVTVDSLRLCDLEPLGGDTISLYRGDELVIADYLLLPADTVDTVWVKVAHDQYTMGWIPEHQLLDGTVPVDPISKVIHLFSNVRVVLFVVLLGIFSLLLLYRRLRRQPSGWLRFKEIRSIYSVWLVILVACAATLYGSIQHFTPGTWQHYYYHPTLNPFVLPFVPACFLIIFWSIILVTIAVIDELFHRSDFSTAFFYLSGLFSLCLLCYLFFTLSSLYYVGYPCLLLLLHGAFRLLRQISFPYRCGQCGAELKYKGPCPNCGAYNK